MSYVLYPLTFDAPVHFGAAGEGGGLTRTEMAFPADSLFSALCAELAASDEMEALDSLLEKAKAGKLRLSNLLPWQALDGEEMAFYLPHPLLVQGEALPCGASYTESCEKATAYKRQKKLRYLRASRLQAYMTARSSGNAFPEEAVRLGSASLRQRVNCREAMTLPYFVGQFDFAPGAGLYLVAYLADEADADWLREILTLVGVSGIGGKRSSGYGAFHLADDPIFLEENGIYEDDTALYALLMAEAAPQQMAIASVLPKEDEIRLVQQGSYRLRKSGGFIGGVRLAAKKDSVCMVEAGSCFAQRMEGRIVSLGEAEGHPIYRYGCGFFVGITGENR